MWTKIGVADGKDKWYRQEPQPVTKAQADDIVEVDGQPHRVSGGYGYRPASLWLVGPAVGDEPINEHLALMNHIIDDWEAHLYDLDDLQVSQDDVSSRGQ